jgi:hypothetical protein
MLGGDGWSLQATPNLSTGNVHKHVRMFFGGCMLLRDTVLNGCCKAQMSLTRTLLDDDVGEDPSVSEHLGVVPPPLLHNCTGPALCVTRLWNRKVSL